MVPPCTRPAFREKQANKGPLPGGLPGQDVLERLQGQARGQRRKRYPGVTGVYLYIVINVPVTSAVRNQ